MYTNQSSIFQLRISFGFQIRLFGPHAASSPDLGCVRLKLLHLACQSHQHAFLRICGGCGIPVDRTAALLGFGIEGLRFRSKYTSAVKHHWQTMTWSHEKNWCLPYLLEATLTPIIRTCYLLFWASSFGSSVLDLHKGFSSHG